MKSTLVSILVLAAGCSMDSPTSQLTQDLTAANGTSLNGVSLNGTSLNGTSLNGLSLNGTSLNGTSLNGTSLNGRSLNGTSLNGTSLNGTSAQRHVAERHRVDGPALRRQHVAHCASIAMFRAPARTATSRCTACRISPSSGWSPLCGLDTDGTPILAIPVPGVWNTEADVVGGGAYSNDGTQFTWSCRAKTIAKCVEMGYKNWNGYSEQLQSCVRMLRGDYCGNGHAYTANGQLVNLYDDAGIQLDTESWGAEAEWTSAGARCILDTAHTRYTHVGNPTPSCVTAGTLPVGGSCGSSLAGGATLIDELPAF